MNQIPINYYPLLNSGHSLTMAGKLDPWRMYYNKATYKIQEIVILPDFDLKISPNPMDADILYADYLLLLVEGNIDYNVLTSLN